MNTGGEMAHSQHMLLALSQAALAVQRARTPDEVYRAVGDEVARLGYHAMVFALADDGTHLFIPYLNFRPDLTSSRETGGPFGAERAFAVDAGQLLRAAHRQGRDHL